MIISERTISELEGYDASDGMDERLFHAVSTLVPIANVDLMILDSDNRILLKKKNRRFFGNGWHIPGGCIRFRETMEERIRRTALSELGTDVVIGEVITVKDVIIDYKRETVVNQDHRAHHLAVLYACTLPENVMSCEEYINNLNSGDLKWFDKLPGDFLRVHDVYTGVLAKYGLFKEC